MKMSQDTNNEDKKPMGKGQDTQHKGMFTFRPFKSSIGGLEVSVFESGTVRHAAQFMKTVEAIAKYIQINFNSDVAEAIRKVKQPIFKLPTQPREKNVISNDGKIIKTGPDEMDVFIWNKGFEKRHKKQAELKKKKDKCSLLCWVSVLHLLDSN